MAEREAWAAASRRSCQVSEGEHGDRRSCARSRSSSSRPNPQQPRKRFDEEALQALAESLERARRAAADARAPARRRDATSSSPASAAGARRSSRASRRCPAIVAAAATTPRRSRPRSSRTWRARTSTRSRRRAPCAALVEELGLTREEVGRRVGPQPRRGLQPAAPARPARRGARAARGRLAHRGPRPRAAAGRGPRRPPPPRPRGGRRRLVGARRSRSARARPTRPALARAKRGRAAVHPGPGGRRRAEIAEALGAALGPRSACARAAPATRSSSPFDGRRRGRCAPGAAALRRPSGRLIARYNRATLPARRAISSVG